MYIYIYMHIYIYIYYYYYYYYYYFIYTYMYSYPEKDQHSSRRWLGKEAQRNHMHTEATSLAKGSIGALIMRIGF